MCYMALGVRHDIHFTERQHIKGIHNVQCDALSRNTTPAMLGFSGDEIINTSSHCWLDKLLCACNPNLIGDGEGAGRGYEVAWRLAFALAEELML